MGYSTEFKGHFVLDRPITSEAIIGSLTRWAEGEPDAFNYLPFDGYCQWRLTEDKQGLEWDQQEKFYSYDVWLQMIIDHLLIPLKYCLTGEVEFQGEDVGDHGFLYIEENIVKIRKVQQRTMICPHCHRKIVIPDEKP